MAELRFEGVGRRFGAEWVLRHVDLEARPGEFFAILGPSGCGKTTLLRMVAGFLEPTEGRIRHGDRDLGGLPPERRDAAMVFQSYALFPHLDVGENVAFGLRARKVDGEPVKTRVARALELVNLAGSERRDVATLSGGEQQRVALARALVVEPRLLLLDEPMSNLDQKLREETRRDLRDLQRRLGLTTLHVTHDQHEALEMADRVAVLARGRVAQVGTPRELYDRPASEFVARFLGRANLIPVGVRSLRGGTAEVELPGGGCLEVPAPRIAGPGPARLVVRPEALELGAAGAGRLTLGEGTVAGVSFQGATIEVTLELGPGATLRAVELNRDPEAAPRPGARVAVSAIPERLVLVPGEEAQGP